MSKKHSCAAEDSNATKKPRVCDVDRFQSMKMAEQWFGLLPTTAKITFGTNPLTVKEYDLYDLLAGSETVRNLLKYAKVDRTAEFVPLDFTGAIGASPDVYPTVHKQIQSFPEVEIDETNVVDCVGWHAFLLTKGYAKCDKILTKMLKDRFYTIQECPGSVLMRNLIDEFFSIGKVAVNYNCPDASPVFHSFIKTFHQNQEHHTLASCLSIHNWEVLFEMCQENQDIADTVLKFLNHLPLTPEKLNRDSFSNALLPSMVSMKMNYDANMLGANRLVQIDCPPDTKREMMNNVMNQPPVFMRWIIEDRKFYMYSRGSSTVAGGDEAGDEAGDGAGDGAGNP